jgi:hypothetical protein
MQVFVNTLQEGNSIMYEFRDERANRFGIGAKITIYYGENDEGQQVRELKSGGGFVSFDPPEIHFGLGGHDRVKRAVIDWPDGSRSEIREPMLAGRKYTISRSADAAP